MGEEIVFTSSALLDFLVQVDELKDLELGLADLPNGDIQVSIGESVYIIDCKKAEDVDVPAEVVETVSDINADAFDQLLESDDIEQEPEDTLSLLTEGSSVEGGLVKEIAKTLYIGGLARLSGGVVKDMLK